MRRPGRRHDGTTSESRTPPWIPDRAIFAGHNVVEIRQQGIRYRPYGSARYRSPRACVGLGAKRGASIEVLRRFASAPKCDDVDRDASRPMAPTAAEARLTERFGPGEETAR
jgi:hypothetical protein